MKSVSWRNQFFFFYLFTLFDAKFLTAVKKLFKTDFRHSHAVRLGSIIYSSGQVGSDPKTRTLVPGGIAPETRQALTNLKNILESAGASLTSGELADNSIFFLSLETWPPTDRDCLTVAKCTVFLADMDEFADMNKVYAECES